MRMKALLLIPVVCVAHAATAWTAPRLSAGVEATDQPMVSPELLNALRMDKFEGLPEPLLADRDALVRQLEAVIAKPPGESKESTRFIRRRAIIVLGMYGGAKAIA